MKLNYKQLTGGTYANCYCIEYEDRTHTVTSGIGGILLFKSKQDAEKYIKLLPKSDYYINKFQGWTASPYLVEFIPDSIEKMIEEIIIDYNNENENYINDYHLKAISEHVLQLFLFQSEFPITINSKTGDVYYDIGLDEKGRSSIRIMDADFLRCVSEIMTNIEEKLEFFKECADD